MKKPHRPGYQTDKLTLLKLCHERRGRYNNKKTKHNLKKHQNQHKNTINMLHIATGLFMFVLLHIATNSKRAQHDANYPRHGAASAKS